MGEIEKEIGGRIRASREKLGLTQRQLADAVATSAPNVNYYEKGTRSAPLEMLIKIARALGVSTDHLLLGVDAQFFADERIAAVLKDLCELPPRDRCVVMGMIQILKDTPEP